MSTYDVETTVVKSGESDIPVAVYVALVKTTVVETYNPADPANPILLGKEEVIATRTVTFKGGEE